MRKRGIGSPRLRIGLRFIRRKPLSNSSLFLIALVQHDAILERHRFALLNCVRAAGLLLSSKITESKRVRRKQAVSSHMPGRGVAKA